MPRVIDASCTELLQRTVYFLKKTINNECIRDSVEEYNWVKLVQWAVVLYRSSLQVSTSIIKGSLASIFVFLKILSLYLGACFLISSLIGVIWEPFTVSDLTTYHVYFDIAVVFPLRNSWLTPIVECRSFELASGCLCIVHIKYSTKYSRRAILG